LAKYLNVDFSFGGGGGGGGGVLIINLQERAWGEMDGLPCEVLVSQRSKIVMLKMKAGCFFHNFKRQTLALQTGKQIPQPDFEAQQYLYCSADP
jgi:hypothetical protein